MPNAQQLLLVLLGLGVLFGPDIYKAASQLGSGSSSTSAEPQEVDVDQGLSLDGRVHVSFCTS